ncbi:DEAD/DEAH box helicase [Gordonia paraffinivorans]|uniref:DEAD/DEAH box helicase n=1 Tax=Gordonia paraffinivorans TaxID=175628 RepID=UPI0027E13896|nr:DEAD/DEAH box helicase [Gordonia paraffinivorans]
MVLSDQLSPAEIFLLSGFDARTIERAAVYAGQRRVVVPAWDPHRLYARGTCRGSEPTPYSVEATFADTGGAQLVLDDTDCSCPVGYRCKHGAAFVLTLSRLGHMRRGQDVRPPAGPSWRTLLKDLVGPTERPSEPGTAPIGLLVEIPGPGGVGTPALRLVTPNKNGNWVRTGITWSSIEPGYEADPFRATADHPAHHFNQVHLDRVRAVHRLFDDRYSYGTTQVHELGRASSEVWPAIRAAVDDGVALIPHKSTEAKRVELLAGSRAALNVDRDDDGLVVSGRVDVEGFEPMTGIRLYLMGSPAHGISFVHDATLYLAPFEPPASDRAFRSLLEHGEIRVPAEETADFSTEILPGLAGSMPVDIADGALAEPEIEGPAVELTVRLTDDGGALTEWATLYRVNGRRHAYAHGQPAGFGDRDAERRLWQTIRPHLEASARVCASWAEQAAGYQRGAPLRERDAPLDDMNRDDAISSAPIALLTRRYRYAPVETALLVDQVLPELRAAGVEVVIVGEVPDYRAAGEPAQIAIGAAQSDESDWLDLSVTIEVAGTAVPLHKVLAALSTGATHMLLDDGVYFLLDTPELRRLAELVAEARELGELDHGRVRSDTQNVTLWNELLDLGVVDKDLAQWRERLRRLAAATPPTPCPIPAGLDADLRDYQSAGLDWLYFLWQNRIGGILADDMGLGKTLQSLALMAAVIEEQPLGCFLVVAPTSVVSNWAAEAARFVPGLKVVTVTETSRRSKVPFAERIAGAQLVVTSYALMRIGFDDFGAVGWTGVIFDEAQFVKNYNSKAHQCARRLDAEFKLAITGTPMENNLMELWSLLSLTAPGLFPSPKTFTEYFRKPIENGTAPERLEVLRRRIHPIMLRRTKDQVVTDLPPKQEQLLSIDLHAKHDRIYHTRLTRERQSLLGLLADFDGNHFEIFRSLTTLRQLSLHAGLVDEAHADVASAKIDFLTEQIPELVAEGHSALVFSQFTGFLRLVEKRLADAGVEYSYLDGSMTARKRAAEVKRFTGGSSKVFLISLKAGGFGLNLTEADYLLRVRSVVESGGRGAGDRPDAPDRSDSSGHRLPTRVGEHDRGEGRGAAGTKARSVQRGDRRRRSLRFGDQCGRHPRASRRRHRRGLKRPP